MHQDHYFEKLRTIEDKIFSNFKEDTLLPPAHAAQYMTLLGCLASLVIMRPDIAIFVSALQKHAKQPEVRHLRRLNTVLSWVRRKKCSLYYAKDIQQPLRVVAVNNSAFRKEANTGLAMRGTVII
eukprot:16216401-Heterocapsa_arctica.AAC.1